MGYFNLSIRILHPQFQVFCMYCQTLISMPSLPYTFATNIQSGISYLIFVCYQTPIVWSTQNDVPVLHCSLNNCLLLLLGLLHHKDVNRIYQYLYNECPPLCTSTVPGTNTNVLKCWLSMYPSHSIRLPALISFLSRISCLVSCSCF